MTPKPLNPLLRYVLPVGVVLGLFFNSATPDDTLDRYVGAYPCAGQDQFFRDPRVISALRKALGVDYMAYEEHRSFSGCGKIERFGEYLFVDISELHVGGYTSFVFVPANNGSAYVFWLKQQVGGPYQIYGNRPVPPIIMTRIEQEMNTQWGHVATFKATGDKLESVMMPRKQ